MSIWSKGHARRSFAVAAAAALPLAVVACDALIDTHDRFFDDSDDGAVVTNTTDSTTTDAPGVSATDSAADANGGTDGPDSGHETDGGGSMLDASDGGATDGSADAADGSSCEISGTCPLPSPVASFPVNALPITGFDADAMNLYIGVSNTGLYVVPVGGGTPLLFWIGDGTHRIDAVRVFSSNVYMLELDSTRNEEYLYDCPLATVIGTGLASGCTQSQYTLLDRATAFSIAGSYIFFVGANSVGEAPFTVNSSFSTAPVPGATALASNATSIFAVGSGSLNRIPISPFATGNVANLNVVATSVAADTSNVYATDRIGGRILQLSSSYTGSEQPFAIAQSQLAPTALTLDGTTLFWVNGGTDAGAGSVASCPAPDCNALPAKTVQRMNAPKALVVKSDALYVQDVDAAGRQVIYRLPR